MQHIVSVLRRLFGIDRPDVDEPVVFNWGALIKGAAAAGSGVMSGYRKYSGAVVASGAGVYTAENIVIPADAYIISIAGYSDGNFDAATTAVMDVGDGTDPDAYIDAQDVKSAGALTLTAGAAGLLGYSASARTISSSITTDGTSTAVGEATLRVDYMMMQSSTEAGKIAVGLDS